MAKRLSEKEKEELVERFKRGKTIEALSEEFSFTNVTIIRNLKKNLGIPLFNKLTSKNKKSDEENIIQRKINNKKDNIVSNYEGSYNLLKSDEDYDNEHLNNMHPVSEFVEITPLNFDIENAKRKELSSIPISEIEFPKMVYMIVDKNIELEIKLLKDYPNWDFLPSDDLNRKTIEIYDDIKLAKRFCKKEQRVIKVPNTDVFRKVSHILISKGISRIICTEQLISL